MNKTATHWHWELTPDEDHQNFFFSNATVPIMPAIPFHKIKRQSLPDTTYEFQLAMGTQNVDEDMRAILKVHPELAVNDHRSGIILFDNDKIMGWFLTSGHTVGYNLYIDQFYQKQGIGLKMLSEWKYRIKRPFALRRQSINVPGLKTGLAAHAIAVQRAISEGKNVPRRVIEAIEYGEQARELMRKAKAGSSIGHMRT